jgi:excisionase family DNA binding protein
MDIDLKKDYVSPSEAARRIGVSGLTLRLWLKSGKIGYIETPLGRLIPVSEVERVIEERRMGEVYRDER